MLASNLLKQHHLLDKLAGLAPVMSYDLFTMPSETLKTISRDVISPQARGYHSVSVIIAKSRTASATTTALPAKSVEFDDTIPARLAGPPARFVAGAPDTSAGRRLSRPTVAVAPAAQRLRTGSQTGRL